MVFSLCFKSAKNLLVNNEFSKLCAVGVRYSKYGVPIKWKKPAKLLFCDPKVTGDLTMEVTVDWSKPPILYEKSKEYETASDLVKKAFSCKFISRKSGMSRYRDEMINKVKHHKLDTDSTEVQIAAKTAIIRNLYQHYHKYPLDKRTKIYYFDLIQKRKSRLKYLRKYDYKSFEWILDQLDLMYKPYPVFERVERKKSIRRLTAKYCEEFISKKLETYRQQLNDQKADFLKEKLETLQRIQQEELHCGIEPTVTDEHIQQTKDELQKQLSTIVVEKKVDDEQFRLSV